MKQVARSIIFHVRLATEIQEDSKIVESSSSTVPLRIQIVSSMQLAQ